MAHQDGLTTIQIMSSDIGQLSSEGVFPEESEGWSVSSNPTCNRKDLEGNSKSAMSVPTAGGNVGPNSGQMPDDLM